jgi:heme exporter protein B
VDTVIKPSVSPIHLGPSAYLAFSTILHRDIIIAFRQRGDIANPMLFFLMIAVLMPIGLSPDPKALSALAPGLIWVIALLAILLSLDGLFRSDYEDGALEQLILSPQPLYFIVLAKIIAHWLTTGLTLTLVSPLLGILLFLPTEGFVPMIFSLLIGTASLSLIGAIGAALTVSIRKGGVLLSLIIMPLYTPVLIFGVATIESAVGGNSIGFPLAILGASLTMGIALAPLAIGSALKMSI